MTDEMVAPGLPIDWINGWLAAVGITVLLPDVHLSWTDDPLPLARLHGDALPERLLTALPTVEEIKTLPVGRASHNVGLDEFEALADDARASRDPYVPTLVTDLVRGPDAKRSDFNPVARTAGEGLLARYERCRNAVMSADQIEATLVGAGRRVQGNGLGFDFRRLHAAQYPGDPELFVDPVVESLCFAALPMFPVRGSGRDWQQTRGWLRVNGVGQRRFVWAAWSGALDRWAIDALMDAVHRSIWPTGLRRLGVTSVFETVRFARRGKSDVSAGYASRRLW